jgi:UDP-N-acetylglucosamine 2-epimerase
MDNLAREGLAARAELVGDVMVDSLAWAASRAAAHLPPAARDLGRYVLLTLHRAENVDDPARLAAIVAGLDVGLPVVFPLHPRTRGALGRAGLTTPANVVAIEPVGYLEMVALEASAEAIATDSGGVQKEAYLAGVPCVTLRDTTEWVETVEVGWNVLVDLDAERALEELRREPPPEHPELYGDGRAGERVVSAIDALAPAATPRV